MTKNVIQIRMPEKLAEDKRAIKKGYVYLRYYNVVDSKVSGLQRNEYNMTEYSAIFGEMSKVYANGGAEIWKK